MNNRQKKKHIKVKNKKLIGRYPWLLPRNRWTDKVPKNYDYTYTEAYCFPAGWRKAFFTEMHEELREELIRCNYLDKFRITQIKEKYGRLCYYTKGIPVDCRVDEIIHKYEHLSKYICIECGKLGVPNIPVNGWYSPTCEHCYNKKIASIDKWYLDHGYEPHQYESYQELLNNVDDDFTLPTVLKVTRRVAGKDWETIEIDISDTVNKLNRQEILI